MSREVAILLSIILIAGLLSLVDWVDIIFALAFPVVNGVEGILESVFGLISGN